MKTDEEPHPLHCVAMKIFQGTMNNKGKTYGRFCCSANGRLYPVGTILMYIFYSKSYLYTNYELILYHLTYICLYDIYRQLIHTSYRNFSICCMKKNVIPIQYIEKLSIYCMDKRFLYIQLMEKFSICCMDKLSIYVI